MVEIRVTYEGALHCRAVHGPSSASLQTDAPVDNQGKGESFSPTDLVATALGSCMLTVMGILGNRRGWDIEGLSVRVHKEMSRELPRRIARLAVEFSVPDAVAQRLDAEARAALEHAAHTCPVRLSIHEAIEVPVVFHW